jgi:glycosyltransferase involved in cell wall biosynthesis
VNLFIAALSSQTSPTGVCRHAANLAKGMLEHPEVRHVTLATGAWQAGYMRDAFGLCGDRLIVLPVPIANTALSRNLWYLWGLPRLARRVHADIIHLSYPAPVFRPLLPAPAVVTVHDLYAFDLPQNFGGRRAWLNRGAFRVCLRNADALACVSEATRARLHARIFTARAKKASVVPNSVVHGSAAHAASLPAELQRSPFVLCVAQHRANKNLPALVAAFDLARRQGIFSFATKLVIVGSFGPVTHEILAVVETYGLGADVVFLKNLTDPVLSALYAGCALLVAPSLVEGFGLPVAEALAFGCRVVCSDIAAFREIGGESCFYFDPQDRSGAAMAEAMQEAQAAPRAAKIEMPGPGEAAAQYLRIYRTLLCNKSAKSLSVAKKASGQEEI